MECVLCTGSKMVWAHYCIVLGDPSHLKFANILQTVLKTIQYFSTQTDLKSFSSQTKLWSLTSHKPMIFYIHKPKPPFTTQTDLESLLLGLLLSHGFRSVAVVPCNYHLL